MLESIIRQVPLFSKLPPAEIDALASGLKDTIYSASTVLFREGEIGDRFYIVAGGQVAILKAMDTPEERLLGVRGSGEFIGEMSLLNRDELRTASARVHTDARLLEMTRSDFDALLNRQPTIAYEMLRVLSERLRSAHNQNIHDLQEKNRQLSEAYAHLKATQAQLIEKEALERELERAREIQESMLPEVLPRLKGFDLGARMVPARVVGGDFFDVIAIDGNSLGLVIGDVAGKGVPAALFMALSRSLLRAEACRSAHPIEVLLNVNRHLLDMNAQGMFVTALFGLLRRSPREFIYVRAGHDPPLLIDKAGNPQRPEIGRGQILGLFPDPILETRTLALSPGSTLLMYTDGVTEAKDEQENFFGLDKLLSLLPDRLNTSAQGLCDSLIETLTAYHGSVPQADDITLMAVRTRP